MDSLIMASEGAGGAPERPEGEWGGPEAPQARPRLRLPSSLLLLRLLPSLLLLALLPRPCRRLGRRYAEGQREWGERHCSPGGGLG